ncbi:glycogen debranching protein GlgX [Actinomycetospora sp. TBRC 11914]|uniref:glycogen debranching protein GlgX n=1 Tax=Actinomycetospora sp. TBRC 11914 TaxID=2729387 RepID=UPI00145E6FF5|nr:glycogen debranching protein GlgX [Actinomycetospora sp. TBRC 11914]NMO91240.1 glycogen debranching protein GlgX [Actinomycetospora sp. TBRC 11914]
MRPTSQGTVEPAAALPTDTPAGAVLRADGVLAVAVPAAASAEAVELCLLAGEGGERRVELARDAADGWWRGSIPGVAAGQGYGLRVHGPWSPRTGVRTDPAKLLVDPWAKRVGGRFTDLSAALAHAGDDPFGPRSGVDSAGSVPFAVATGPVAPAAVERPAVPWRDTVLYETHVRDLTMRHPEVPPELRGTYGGVAHPAVVDHLRRLGVTTVELLPVFANAPEPSLMTRGRRNHWGYSTLAYLAPEPRYAAVPGQEVAEVRAMVDALHAAGLEVVLDVVFNHTCEGGVGGPSLSWRGLDAPSWYQLSADGRDIDLTGCGNTLDAGSPLVARLVLDCLRYWVTTMGVDGFRFDLASTLGRPGGSAFSPHAPLLTAIAEDPVLASVKLIAEPWDATGEGYQVGGFGPAWAEWNGRYRDGVRDFWRGHGPVSEIVTRFAGSSDLYWPARGPAASVDFVTAHDGFTLRDLVSYDHKHNAAHGEDNRDGTDDNRSWNSGVEGPSSDAAVEALRGRRMRNLLATLGLSAGTPMLLGGDELGHTQLGDNNAYCMDDETSWRDWSDRSMVPFVERVFALRRSVPELRRDDFYYGHSGLAEGEVPDIVWLSETARELGPTDWADPRRTLVVRVRSASSLLVVLHAGHEPVDVVLPSRFGDTAWTPVLDSRSPDGEPADPAALAAGSRTVVPPHTFLAFRST